jgi:hypothetical protein
VQHPRPAEACRSLPRNTRSVISRAGSIIPSSYANHQRSAILRPSHSQLGAILPCGTRIENDKLESPGTCRRCGSFWTEVLHRTHCNEKMII